MYAYSQLNLLPENARHCNFNIINGDMAGTKCFETGFYGFTYVLAESSMLFFDNLLIVISGRFEEHLNLVRRSLFRIAQITISEKRFKSIRNKNECKT